MTTYSPEVHPHRRLHVNPWLAVVVLAVALVGLGTWVIIDRYTGGATSTEDATTLIDDMYAASSAHDAQAITALVAPDVVLWVNDSTVTGRKAVVNEIMTTPGLQIERAAPVTVEGEFASTFAAFTASAAGVNRGLMAETVQMKNGKIYRIWDFGIGATPPFTNTADVTVPS